MTSSLTELVLATRNRDKGRELAAILADVGVRIRTLDEFPGAPEVIEDGETCEANAIQKALSAARYTGLPAVADDTGLMVDALDGCPGVLAARYAGKGATYEDNWRKLLRELQDVPWEGRGARFVTVAALAGAGDQVEAVEGVLKGYIMEGPVGAGGFGYDPVFWVPELGKTLAQLSPADKNRISHRARAFRQLKERVLQHSRIPGAVGGGAARES